jgi:hypothetical protein
MNDTWLFGTIFNGRTQLMREEGGGGRRRKEAGHTTGVRWLY